MATHRTRFAATFWTALGAAWLSTTGLAGAFVIAPVVARATRELPGAVAPLLLASLAAAAIWGYGLLQLAHWAANPAARRLLHAEQRHAEQAGAARVPWAATTASGAPRVVVVAPVADDFRPDVLRRTLAQTVPVHCAILDDSRDPGVRSAVDDFAVETGAQVIRRRDRRAYKAGNLNHALPLLLPDADFLVIVDSDSEIPEDYVERALPHFTDAGVGAVQGRPWARSGATPFAHELRGLLGGLLAATQASHAVAGLSPFLGRGGMFSTACLRRLGGFPERVFEDVSMSIALRQHGFRTVYLDNVVCAEDYPVDYRAFRVQYGKHAEGCAELLRERRLLRGLPIAERLDVRTALAMPLVLTLAGVTLLVANLALTVLGAGALQLGVPLPVLAAVGLGAAAPLLPEVLRLIRAGRPIRAARFAAVSGALYATMLVLGAARTLRVLRGSRGRFRVTPKTSAPTRLGTALRMLRAEWAVAAVACVLATVLGGVFAPLMPLLLPAVAGTAFALWPQHPPRRVTRVRVARAQPHVGATS